VSRSSVRIETDGTKMSEQPFMLGDLVFHRRLGDTGEDDDHLVGHVIGFCPSPRWLRIKTGDGKKRIWLRHNVENCDFICGEGNYAGNRT
jgi:hypothetical protein